MPFTMAQNRSGATGKNYGRLTLTCRPLKKFWFRGELTMKKSGYRSWTRKAFWLKKTCCIGLSAILRKEKTAFLSDFLTIMERDFLSPVNQSTVLSLTSNGEAKPKS